MRRIFPLLLILLLLCGCGGNRDAAAPEDADRLVIFTARSTAVYDDAVREFERRTGIWVEVHTADDALPLLEQIAAGQRCDLLLGVTPDCLSACGELFAPYAPEAAADIPTPTATTRTGGRPSPCCRWCSSTTTSWCSGMCRTAGAA